jgi:hypothetical protein
VLGMKINPLSIARPIGIEIQTQCNARRATNARFRPCRATGASSSGKLRLLLNIGGFAGNGNPILTSKDNSFRVKTRGKNPDGLINGEPGAP